MPKRLTKTLYQRPILSTEIDDRIADAISSCEHRGKWSAWGLNTIREQGVAILLHGPPGTGKTMTGHYIAKRLHLGVCEVSIADYGSQVPGQLARNIKTIFNGEQILAAQEKRQPAVILLDECDSMLVSRKRLGSEMLWMLEPINALLAHIGKYPGIVVLATNLLPMLDEALERRLIAKIHIGRPDESVRRKIWKAKFPDKFPCQPTAIELDILATYDLSGAQVENALIIWAGRMLRHGIDQPVIGSLISFVSEEFAGYYQSGNGEFDINDIIEQPGVRL
jgi:SpoVK/Ycf46/Vps4 family AAA+-type ATPase